MKNRKEFSDSLIRNQRIVYFLNKLETLVNFLDLEYCDQIGICENCKTEKICHSIGDIQEAFSNFRIAVKEEL